MNRNITLYLSVIILLFGGTGVLYKLGWVMDFYGAPFYQKLRPEFYFLFFALFSFKVAFSKKIIQNEISILFLCLFISIYLFLLNQQGGFAVIINALAIPSIISILLIYSKQKDIFIIRKIILAFFITNSSIAILERLFAIHFIPYYNGGRFYLEAEIEYISMFRSHALRNHPLSNALLTSIIMSFILVTPYLKNIHKTTLFLLGYISILCFNTRGCIITTSILTYLFLIYNITTKNVLKLNKKKTIIVICLATSLVIYMFSLNYGGRLLEEDNLNDTSIEARFKVFDAFAKIRFSELLFGGLTIVEIQKLVGLKSIENYWFLFICRFGVLFLSLFVFYFYKILKKWFKREFFASKLYIVLIFLLTSSVNNSIYGGDPAIALLILCSFAFLPSIHNCNHHKKNKLPQYKQQS